MTSVSYEQKNTDEVLYPSITICPTYSTLGPYALWEIAPKPPKVFLQNIGQNRTWRKSGFRLRKSLLLTTYGHEFTQPRTPSFAQHCELIFFLLIYFSFRYSARLMIFSVLTTSFWNLPIISQTIGITFHVFHKISYIVYIFLVLSPLQMTHCLIKW